MENKTETIDKLCNEINKATCNMLSYLKKVLIESGEREMSYYENKAVPIDVMADDGEDVKHYFISKIRYNDGIEIFDENDGWFPLAELDTDTIVILITYIVW